MALLSGALADRARTVRSIAVGERIEGRTQVARVSDSWFAARIVVVAPAAETDDHGHRRLVQKAQLLCGTAGIRSSDELDVESATAGDGRWRVTGEPLTIRTRRLGLACIVTVERLHEAPPTELIA